MSDSFGDDQPVTVNQVGLGMYEAIVPVPEVGHTVVRFHDKTEKQLKVLHHQTDYPAEYRLGSVLPKELAALPLLSISTVLDNLGDIDRPESRRNWFLFAALVSALGSVLLRRV